MKAILIAVVMILAGCDSSSKSHDQCIRSEIFQQCISVVKDKNMNGKDADVIKECDTAAYYQSIRNEAVVKPECRPS